MNSRLKGKSSKNYHFAPLRKEAKEKVKENSRTRAGRKTLDSTLAWHLYCICAHGGVVTGRFLNLNYCFLCWGCAVLGASPEDDLLTIRTLLDNLWNQMAKGWPNCFAFLCHDSGIDDISFSFRTCYMLWYPEAIQACGSFTSPGQRR